MAPRPRRAPIFIRRRDELRPDAKAADLRRSGIRRRLRRRRLQRAASVAARSVPGFSQRPARTRDVGRVVWLVPGTRSFWYLVSSQTPPSPPNGRAVDSSPHGFPVARERTRHRWAKARSVPHAAGTVGRMAKRRKKRWSELGPVARMAIVVGSAAEFVVTAVALRDLVRRPAPRCAAEGPLGARPLRTARRIPALPARRPPPRAVTRSPRTGPNLAPLGTELARTRHALTATVGVPRGWVGAGDGTRNSAAKRHERPASRREGPKRLKRGRKAR